MTNPVELRQFHAVVTTTALHLVRRGQVAPQTFETEYSGFMTSHGPHDRDGMLDTFENEWPDVLLIRRKDIMGFLDGSAAELTL